MTQRPKVIHKTALVTLDGEGHAVDVRIEDESAEDKARRLHRKLPIGIREKG